MHLHRTQAVRVVSLLMLLAGSSVYGAQEAAPARTQGGAQAVTLTLAQATELAVKNNVQTVISRERILQARGEKGISLSYLLPNLAGSAAQMNQTTNLAAIGFSANVIPGLSPFLGPYSVFDARIRLTQTVFNLGAIRQYQADKHGQALAIEQERFVTEQVKTATALAYLAVLQSEQAVENAKANEQLAQTLLDLANSQRTAGVATGVDVARAETRLANQQVAVAEAQTSLDTARLDLLRVAGLPLGQTVTLAESMKFAPEAKRDVNATIGTALTERRDLRAASEQVEIGKSRRQAALAGYAPSVAFVGDYGSSGIKPNEVNLPTRSVGLHLDVPIFNGGRTRAEVQVASSVERQAEAQRNDLKAAIEKDVRQALDNLVTREAQVRAAQKAVALASRELELAQDRFKNGVADNIELVNAQTALENARLTLVGSLAQFNVARLNLASAMGRVDDFRL